MLEKSASRTSGALPILLPKKTKEAASKPKPGRGRIRAYVLIGVHVVILAHITHFWISGRTLSPIEPSDSMYTLELGQVNAGIIFFALAILSTAIFGRFFCGWGCHIVALQDLSGHLLRGLGLRPKPFRSRLLAVVPFVLAFYMFLWPTVKRLSAGTQHPGFSNHLVTDNFWYYFPGPIVSLLTFAVCGGLIVYLLGNKGFCTYACPYGAFFSVADRLAVGRIRVTDACLQCGQCTAHCTSNVQVHAEVRDFGMVVDPGCMKCMDCVSVCPHDALYFGLTTRPGSKDASRNVSQANQPPRTKKTYDYSLAEELSGLVVAGFTVFAVRGLYDIMPLLLSVAVGVITAYLAIQTFRIFRLRDQRVQNLQLKRNGRITRKGWIAVGGFGLWAIVLFHSFFVQYHRYQGRQYLTRISVTWETLLSGNAQASLTGEDRANIEKALKSYQLTDQIGIVDVKEVKLGLAFISLMNNDLRTAEVYLRQAYACRPSEMREFLREFLLTQNRAEEAAVIH
jgi:polyferredoxin